MPGSYGGLPESLLSMAMIRHQKTAGVGIRPNQAAQRAGEAARQQESATQYPPSWARQGGCTARYGAASPLLAAPVKFEERTTMATITFTGAQLLSVSRTPKKGVLNFAANLTQPVSKKLGWGPLPDKCLGDKMEGSINAASLIFAPKQTDLFNGNEFRAECQSLGHFQIVRRELEQSKGKGFRRELRFQGSFIAEGVAAMAESWLIAVGDGKGELKVSGTIAEASDEAEDEKE